MNLFIFHVGLKKMALVAANYEIARAILNKELAGGFNEFRSIALRDMPKSQKNKYRDIIADPEQVFVKDETTNEWRREYA